jgi:hypothetical protein
MGINKNNNKEIEIEIYRNAYLWRKSARIRCEEPDEKQLFGCGCDKGKQVSNEIVHVKQKK